MANNVAASMKASIVIDKKELISSALSAYAEAQKELDGNKIELLVDVSDDKALKKLKEIQKELTGKEYILKFKNQGTDEILESLDVLEKRLKDIFSGKAFGTGTGKGIGNSIVDEKSLQNVLDLFTKMESHLGDMKRVFLDVGDGGEFSPLLSTIEKINTSIKELSKSVKGIGLNMNIDFGSDKELEAKAEAKISNALQAYQRLFEHIKMSGAGGSIITQKFFDFDIDQFDGMMGKLNAYKKFIENMRAETKGQFNGNDVLYQETDKKYWTSVASAMGQVTKAFNEMKASGDTNPLEKIFGGSQDLTKVVSQLSLIVNKLDEISKSASEFTNVFKDGLDVSSSVKDIEKLTNRVKELEEELSKVKLSPTTSTSIKDTFQGDTKVSAESSTPAVKEEAKAMEQVAESAEKASKGKDKFAKANKKVKESADSSSKAVSEEASEFNKIIGKLDGYNTKLSNFTVKPADGNRYPIYQKNIDDITEKIKKLQVLSEKDINLINTNDVEDAKALQKQIDELIFKMSKMSASEKGFDPLGADKALEKIHNELQKNSGMSKEAKRQIQSYYDEIRSGNPSKPIKDLLDDMYKLIQLEREAGRAHKSFNDIFKEKVVYGAAANLAGMIGIYDIINVGRQAVDIVIDLNTQITELAKVSEATSSQIYDDFNSYAEIAKDVGGTISDTISATADWSRNGYNIPDSKELAEVAMIYKNVGDGIDIDQANEYLISTLRGFNLEAKDAMSIIDSMNEVANNEPISASGIGEALQRSAAAFNAANTSLQESIALVTSTNSVLQSPEKVGSMWTTVSARIRGAKTELEEAGLETDGMVESTSKLQSLIKGMTGFDILESDGKTFKSIYDIIVGIGEEFAKLDDIDQASLLEALAGKRQSNALAATLNNIDILKKSYKEATNAEGSAMEEQRKYQESVQYSIDRTKASLEELANDFLSSDFLKGLIDSGDKLINILDWIIDKFGVLGTLAGGAGIFAGAKNVGKRRSTMFYILF